MMNEVFRIGESVPSHAGYVQTNIASKKAKERRDEPFTESNYHAVEARSPGRPGSASVDEVCLMKGQAPRFCLRGRALRRAPRPRARWHLPGTTSRIASALHALAGAGQDSYNAAPAPAAGAPRKATP